MVGALVEEDGSFSDHPLFAGRKCGLEEMGVGNEDGLGCLRAGHHDAVAAQHLRFENGSVPLDFCGEENVGILGVELEGFADVGPAQGARREGEACMAEFEDDCGCNCKEEKEGYATNWLHD